MHAPAPAPAAFLAAGLLLVFPQAALVAGQGTITSDDCLQRTFLSAVDCDQKSPDFTNETLPAAGWFCCWAQGPFLPPPALPVSAWLTLDENGEVADRCITTGSCTTYWELPDAGNGSA